MKTSREFERSIDALKALAAFIGDALPEGIGDRVALHVDLAVEEIFVNMVQHNKPGGEQIAVAVEVLPDSIGVQLEDFDVEPFDPQSVSDVDVTLPASERQAGGLGLHLVKSIVDRLVYEYDDRVMRVSFAKSLEAPRFYFKPAGEDRLLMVGRFDAAEIETAQEVLYALTTSTILDCRQVTYCSSAALGVLFEAQRKLVEAGHGLTLVNLTPHLRELFRLGGFDRVLKIE